MKSSSEQPTASWTPFPLLERSGGRGFGWGLLTPQFMQSVEALSVSKINDKEVFLPAEENHKTLYNTKQKNSVISSLNCSQCIFFLHITITKTFRNMKWEILGHRTKGRETKLQIMASFKWNNSNAERFDFSVQRMLAYGTRESSVSVQLANQQLTL